jgi:ureidoglycolate dehydrogenase (NAD+)
MSDNSQRFVDSDALQQFVVDVFEATGMERDHATVFAENLVDANLRGKESHGLIRLSHYVERIQSGGTNVTPEVTTEQVAPAVARADGDGGPGQVVSTLAVEQAMALAADQGVGVVGVTNSNHFGTVSYYTNQAAASGYVGIGMTYGGPTLAPYGAGEAYFSTNPIAVAAPHDPYPVSLDISTSATTLGNILIAEENSEEIPPQWALDEGGQYAELHAIQSQDG